MGPHTLDDFELFKRSAVTTANISANLRNENMTIRLFVHNVTDVDDPLNVGVSTTYFDNPVVGAAAIRRNAYSVTPRRPRELGISVSYDF